tara:strand:+ start:1310 stop:1717 length:408 start_codon:yes stop_codon:yes gene_type:complete
MSFYNPISGSSGGIFNQEPIMRVELVREARLPAACVLQPRPNHVIINNSGSYAFLYTSTGSSGGTSHYNADDSTAGNEIWVTGSMVLHDTAGAIAHLPIKLDINPVAWRQIDGTITGNTGDVTFVFNAKSVQKKI